MNTELTNFAHVSLLKKISSLFLLVSFFMMTSTQVSFAQFPNFYWNTTSPDDYWVAPVDNSLYVRNNSKYDYEVVTIKKVSNNQVIASSIDLPKGQITHILNYVSISNKTKWEIEIKRKNSGSFDFIFSTDFDHPFPSGYGEDKISGKTYGEVTYGDIIQIKTLWQSSAILTIGDDYFGERGPTRSENPNEITVTSYNVFLGTDSKPEICDRGKHLREALAAMETDVLVLQEMNLRETNCSDGLELAAYLWSGDEGSDNEDEITDDPYAGAGGSYVEDAVPNAEWALKGGSKMSPKKNGAFPYISQFTSGLPMIGINGESRTGGGVILSKYPLELIDNITFGSLKYIGGLEEQKGFLVVRINKNGQDYYILNAHTQKSGDLGIQNDQMRQIRNYLRNLQSSIPSCSRVIIAGDFNSDLRVNTIFQNNMSTSSDDEVGGFQYFEYDNDEDTYFADKRAGHITFYNPKDPSPDANGSYGRQIDWVLYARQPNFEKPKSGSAHAFPVRNIKSKFVDLSDHLGVTATYKYSQLECPEDITVFTETGQCRANVSWTPPTISSDYCATPNIQGTHTPGQSFPHNTTVVTYSADKREDCSFRVTVKNYNLSNCPDNITVSTDPGKRTATVNWTAPTIITDNCSAPTYNLPNLTASHNPGQKFLLGSTEVEYSAGDLNCTFTVTVADMEPPQLTCPENASLTTDPDYYWADLQVTGVSATDNATMSYNLKPTYEAFGPSGKPLYQFNTPSNKFRFEMGVNNIRVTVKDEADNYSQCSFQFTIEDKEPPANSCENWSQVIAGDNPCSQGFLYFSTISYDDNTNVPGLGNSEPLPVTYTLRGKEVNKENFPYFEYFRTQIRMHNFRPGVHTLTKTVTDPSGNSASCDFTITIIDTIPPSIRCPKGIQGFGTLTIPSEYDDCGIAAKFHAQGGDNCLPKPRISYSHPPGSFFPVGVTTVTATATDGSGNSSSCTFDITVEDMSKPEITCPAGPTLDCGADTSIATLGSATATDNCEIKEITSVDNLIEHCPGNYTLKRTWTAVDVHGNKKSCKQNIYLTDRFVPEITCPKNITVSCDIDPATSTGLATATDNCDPNPIVTWSDKVQRGGSMYYTVIKRTWTAEDGCGNYFSCEQTIRRNTIPVIEDALSSDLDGDGITDTLILGMNSAYLTIVPGSGNMIKKLFPTSGTTPKGLKRGGAIIDANGMKNPNAAYSMARLTNPLIEEALKLNLIVRQNPSIGMTKLNSLDNTMPSIVKSHFNQNSDINDLIRITNMALNNTILQMPQHTQALYDYLKGVNEPLRICEY